MRLFKTVVALRCYREQQGQQTVGLVPTMGALHQGHLQLIEQAKRENNLVIVSIFVNPLQFAPTEDFQNYPRNLEQDCLACETLGVDAVFAPTPTELGLVDAFAIRDPQTQPIRQTLVLPPAAMTTQLCGQTRLGHFQGVATIVTKFLNLVQPHRAYFGQKDAQQVAILRQVICDLNLNVTLVECPIVREPSGLAYSSRNQYLTASEKVSATVLYRGLQQAEYAFSQGERVAIALIDRVKTEIASEKDVKLEYVELVHPETLMPVDRIEDAGLLAVAARIGSTRLIDNTILRNRQPIIAIDGPAGAGKSTIAKSIAHHLGLLYLDTGAMYRAVTWLVLNSQIALEDEPRIAELVSQCQIQLMPDRVWINGQEVTQAIRSSEITAAVSAISAQCAVRRELVKQQQRWGTKGGVVAEGRDIGTHVFPDAELKIFLTASLEERARRRLSDFAALGEQQLNLNELEQALHERDRLDSSRSISPLRKAPGAIEIQTDSFTIAQVTEQIITLYHQLVS